MDISQTIWFLDYGNLILVPLKAPRNSEQGGIFEFLYIVGQYIGGPTLEHLHEGFYHFGSMLGAPAFGNLPHWTHTSCCTKRVQGPELIKGIFMSQILYLDCLGAWNWTFRDVYRAARLFMRSFTRGSCGEGLCFFLTAV